MTPDQFQRCATIHGAANELREAADANPLDIQKMMRHVVAGKGAEEQTRVFEHEGVEYRATLTLVTFLSGGKARILSIYPHDFAVEADPETADEMAQILEPGCTRILAPIFLGRKEGYPNAHKYLKRLPC